MPSRQLPQRIVEARLRMDDPDVRERRLGQDECDVTPSELPLERIDVVEFDDPGRHCRIDRRPEVPASRANNPVRAEGRERLVDGAVVAPVEHQDGRPFSQVPREPDREAVRVRGRQGELPGGDTESARQLGGDPERVLGRKHQRDPLG